jgi:hypothetical protein
VWDRVVIGCVGMDVRSKIRCTVPLRLERFDDASLLLLSISNSSFILNVELLGGCNSVSHGEYQ